MNHLLRVATRIITYYGVRNADVVCASLLHDAVEDHAAGLAPGGSRQDALAVLAGQFGDRVAELVASVSNPPHEPGRDRHEQYREHVAASLEASPWARVIEASDFTDNGVGLIHTTGPKLERLASKYAPLVPVLAELISPRHAAHRRRQGPHPRPVRPRPPAIRSDHPGTRPGRYAGLSTRVPRGWPQNPAATAPDPPRRLPLLHDPGN